MNLPQELAGYPLRGVGLGFCAVVAVAEVCPALLVLVLAIVLVGSVASVGDAHPAVLFPEVGDLLARGSDALYVTGSSKRHLFSPEHRLCHGLDLHRPDALLQDPDGVLRVFVGGG